MLMKPGSTKPKKEIKIIRQALYFNFYIMVLAITHPHRVVDLLAYSSIIINASSEYDIPWLLYVTRYDKMDDLQEN